MTIIRELFTGLVSVAAVASLIFGAVSMTIAETSLVGTNEQPPIGSNIPINELPGRQNSAPQGTRSAKIITPTRFVCPIPKGWEAEIVQVDDSLQELAASRAITIKAILDGNCLVSQNLLVGTTLYLPKLVITPSQTGTLPASTLTLTLTPRCGVPRGWVRYTVQPGDTLFKLSLVFGVSVPDLQFANCLTTTLIRNGDSLWVPFIPTRQPSQTRTPTPTPIPTATFSPTALPSRTATATTQVSRTNTVRPSATATRPTATSTATLPASPTATASSTATATATPTPKRLP